MDLLDQAQVVEEAERGAAIRAQHAHAPLAPEDWERVSARWCEGDLCGERIPDALRRAYPGVRLCMECQVRKEQQARLRR